MTAPTDPQKLANPATNPMVDRRTVFRTAGAVGAGAAVVAGVSACSAEEEPAESVETVTVPAADVPVGSGVVVDDQVVVVQPTAGEYRAFSAICPHQGCPVRTITETEIVCPCHSSRFSTSDGSVMSGPAEEGLAPRTVEVAGDQLSVS